MRQIREERMRSEEACGVHTIFHEAMLMHRAFVQYNTWRRASAPDGVSASYPGAAPLKSEGHAPTQTDRCPHHPMGMPQGPAPHLELIRPRRTGGRPPGSGLLAEARAAGRPGRPHAAPAGRPRRPCRWAAAASAARLPSAARKRLRGRRAGRRHDPPETRAAAAAPRRQSCRVGRASGERAGALRYVSRAGAAGGQGSTLRRRGCMEHARRKPASAHMGPLPPPPAALPPCPAHRLAPPSANQAGLSCSGEKISLFSGRSQVPSSATQTSL